MVRCGSYVECYRLCDGIRDGGAGRAELVDSGSQQDDDAVRRTRPIDVLCREWSPDRTDVERLRRMHDTIGEILQENTASVH